MRIQRRGFKRAQTKSFLKKKTKKILWSHFFKRCFLHFEKKTLEKWHEENLFRKDVTKRESKGEKKVVEMRRHWSGLAPKSQFTQHNSHKTCNLALHKAFWVTQASFFFECCEKACASRQWHWPHHRCTAFCRSSTVSEHSKLGELVFPPYTAMCWICGTTTVFLHHFEQHHWQIEQLDFSDFGLVSSVVFIWLLFVFVSPSVFPSITHFIISFQPTPHLLSVNLFLFQKKKLQGCIHFVPVIWQFLSLSSSPKPCWTSAWAFHGSCSCALRRWREPRWLYIFQFACFLFQAVELPFHIFVFLARSLFDLRHRPSNPLGSASPPQVAQSFLLLFLPLVEEGGWTKRE